MWAAHPDELQLPDGLDAGGEVAVGQIVRNDHADAGRMVERLFMPKHHRFVPDLQLLGARADRHQPDRRGGGAFQHRLCFGRNVRALVEAGLFLGQLHRKGQAGRTAAFLAVGLGEQLEDIQCFQCHNHSPSYVLRYYINGSISSAGCPDFVRNSTSSSALVAIDSSAILSSRSGTPTSFALAANRSR